MKVLWFTNTPSLGEEKLSNKPTGGGWIKSLEKGIKENSDIELGVTFYHSEKIKNFSYNHTKYFPIYKKVNNKLKRYINRIFEYYNPYNDVKYYLKVIDEFKPDLIHIHGTEMPFGLILGHTNIPIVISIQGNLNVYSYKYFDGIPKQDALRYSKIIERIALVSSIDSYNSFKKKSLIEKRILKQTKNIIGRTNWDYRITRILAKESKYFHNDEILRDGFYKSKWNMEIDKKIMLFTTNGNSLYKGIETLLYTAHLLEEYGLDFEWNVAGLLETDSIVGKATKSRKINVSRYVSFLGKLNEDKLIEKLLASHIYIMPSHIENSPNNLCEAMILGVPSIATNAGGTNSLLKDRESGILIQDGDPFAMAGAIIELVSDYERAKIYGAKGREVALKRHNKTTIVNDLINIYKSVINEKNEDANC